jgi:aspartyl-tRNA(Asn)/glutamyl-tRNA(Gln) amidotransferase subunit A
MGEASLGSDTGGSIRIPAAACGVVGLKGAYGEIPTDGVVPLSHSFDHVGPIARSVGEAAAIWAVLAARKPVQPSAPGAITLGALGGYFTALFDSHVRATYDGALEKLRAGGVEVESRTIGGTESIMDVYVDISLYEAGQWHAPTLDSRGADYQPAVRERLERGRAIPAERYARALQGREPLRVAVSKALENCDALVLPTLPIVPPLIGSTDVTMDTGESLPVRAAMLRLTQLFNITGNPAISLPLRTTGLPVGLQLVGHANDTPHLIDVAASVETILG